MGVDEAHGRRREDELGVGLCGQRGGDGRDDDGGGVSARVRVAPLGHLVAQNKDAREAGDAGDGRGEDREHDGPALQFYRVALLEIGHADSVEDGLDGAEPLERVRAAGGDDGHNAHVTGRDLVLAIECLDHGHAAVR